MKQLNSFTFAFISASAVLLACSSENALASGSASATIDENGNATSTSSIQGAFLLDGTTTASLGGWGVSTPVLSYAYTPTSSPLAPVPGIVDIFSDAAHTDLIDQVVFLNDGPSYIVLMDVANSGQEASVSSLPTFDISGAGPTVDLTEGMCGITTYTPSGVNGGENGTNFATPGYMDNATLANGDANVTYTFDLYSSYCAPDGGTTVALLGIGLVGLGALKRKLGRN
jgi:hypothetical protein